MDSSYIELQGSLIESITSAPPLLRIRFARALIIKCMTGSNERTRWRQTGVLELAGVDDRVAFPAGPLTCLGGDIDANVYTYRDMIPVPFCTRGKIRCVLRFEGQVAPLTVAAASATLQLDGVAKYLEHLRP